jgi:hypothetical protein
VTPWEQNAHVRDSGSGSSRARPGAKLEERRHLRSAEAVSSDVNRSVPRSNLEEPRVLEVPTRRKSRQRRPGTHEVRVHASRIGWQKSIGRIARLDRREIAKSPGGKKKGR